MLKILKLIFQLPSKFGSAAASVYVGIRDARRIGAEAESYANRQLAIQFGLVADKTHPLQTPIWNAFFNSNLEELDNQWHADRHLTEEP